MRDLATNTLYLHCEECESGWRDPLKADALDSSFLTLEEDFEAVPASKTDIEQHGWAEYVVGEFQIPEGG